MKVTVLKCDSCGKTENVMQVIGEILDSNDKNLAHHQDICLSCVAEKFMQIVLPIGSPIPRSPHPGWVPLEGPI